MAAVPPKSYGISEFKSRALNIAQTSLYQLTIVSPKVIGTAFPESLSLLCYEASLPGSSLMTHDVTNDYHGMSEKMAYRRNYGQEIRLGFYVDRNYNIIDYFEEWIDSISAVVGDKESSFCHHRQLYPELYRSKIHIVKFEKDHFRVGQAPLPAQQNGSKRVLNYDFIDAFPTAIDPMPVSYDQSDILKCGVTFSYTRYNVKKEGTLSSYSFGSTNTSTPSDNLLRNPVINESVGDFYTNPTEYPAGIPSTFEPIDPGTLA